MSQREVQASCVSVCEPCSHEGFQQSKVNALDPKTPITVTLVPSGVRIPSSGVKLYRRAQYPPNFEGPRLYRVVYIL